MTGAHRRAVVAIAVAGRDRLVMDLDESGRVSSTVGMPADDLPAFILSRRNLSPRWVWADTAVVYAPVVAAGVVVKRCADLRRRHTILARAMWVPESVRSEASPSWELGASAAPERDVAPTLFDAVAGSSDVAGVDGADALVAEWAWQRRALAASAHAAGLALLCDAESSAALAATEMTAAGLPWDADVHDRILREALGAPGGADGLPHVVSVLRTRIRELLADARVNPDSPAQLLRALHRAGIDVHGTSRRELSESSHPVIAPLLEYKSLMRLYTANGWAWRDTWVREGRFRPVYQPGGVVTGRWTAAGGGALQIPRVLRPAVRADQGWRLADADVSQLEPRVLAAVSGDRGLAAAARGRDLYAGIVGSGVVDTRPRAKVAMLGALYGSTTGVAGLLVPRLRRTYPRAMGLVDAAARAGERGEVVTTWLGRTSPPASPGWWQVQRRAGLPEATARDGEAARRAAGDRGRFTRNFVVQGSASEWASVWLGLVRAGLRALGPTTGPPAVRSGPAFADRAHVAMFLHDELLVHTPLDQADAVRDILVRSAVQATRLLFPSVDIDFPLDVHVGMSAQKE